MYLKYRILNCCDHYGMVNIISCFPCYELCRNLISGDRDGLSSAVDVFITSKNIFNHQVTGAMLLSFLYVDAMVQQMASIYYLFEDS